MLSLISNNTMKKFILFSLLICFQFGAKSQGTLDSLFTGVLLSVTQTGGSGSTYEFAGNFQNNLGQFAGIEAPSENMVMVVADGGQCYELTVTAITAGSVITGIVVDSSGLLAALPSGNAYIGQKTPNKGIILEGDLMTDEMHTCVENHFRLMVDKMANSGGDDWGNQSIVSDNSLTGSGTPNDPLMIALDKHLSSMTTTSAGNVMVYQFELSDGTPVFFTGNQSNGIFTDNTGATTQTFNWNLGGSTYFSGLNNYDYRKVQLNVNQVEAKFGEYFFSDSLFMAGDDLYFQAFKNFRIHNQTGGIHIKNSQIFGNVQLEEGFYMALENKDDGLVGYRPLPSLGYKEFDLGNDRTASVSGDTSGVAISFTNNTWTIDITNSVIVNDVTISGSDADYNSSNQLMVEVVGGNGNTSYENIRVPKIQKVDMSAKIFGLPSSGIPYTIDTDNNPAKKLIGVGTPSNPEVRLRFEGMNAYSFYGFSLSNF